MHPTHQRDGILFNLTQLLMAQAEGADDESIFLCMPLKIALLTGP